MDNMRIYKFIRYMTILNNKFDNYDKFYFIFDE